MLRICLLGRKHLKNHPQGLDLFPSIILLCPLSHPTSDLFEVVANGNQSQLDEALGFSSEVEASKVHVPFEISKDGFRHLLSRSENGIKVVMYLTMIAAVLLTLYKKLNKIVGWAVAKILFMDELDEGVLTDWHTEVAPAFPPFPQASP